MDQLAQWIAVAVIVAAAAIYLARKLSRPRGTCTKCGCKGCEQKHRQ